MALRIDNLQDSLGSDGRLSKTYLSKSFDSRLLILQISGDLLWFKVSCHKTQRLSCGLGLDPISHRCICEAVDSASGELDLVSRAYLCCYI